MLNQKHILVRGLAILLIVGLLVNLSLIHSAAVSQNLTFTPAADGYVSASNPGTNYGTLTSLRVDSSPVVTSYTRFTVSGLGGQPVSQARLLIHVNSTSKQGLVIKAVANNTWGETTLTYANYPGQGSTLASSPAVSSGSWVTLDVTAFVNGEGTFSFGISTPGSTAISLSSRELGANAPQLIVTINSAVNPTATPTRTVTPVGTNTPLPTSVLGQNLTLSPVADAYVDSSIPGTNYGTSASLRVDASPAVNSFVRFTVPGLGGQAITQARLLIHANSASTQGLVVKSVADNSWSETSITSANAPALGSTLASSVSVASGSWVTLDVTSVVKGQGTFSFGISTPGSTAISLSSRESGVNAPQLVLTFNGSSTPVATVAPSATPTRTVAPTNPASPTSSPTPNAVSSPTPKVDPTVPPASGLHVMRVEYADYANSRGEVATWDQKMQAAGINMVALAAGRTEWAYFKWAGHATDWASAVTDTGIDILADDSTHYGQYAQINAVIDVFAPNYISAHPDKAAINAVGQASPNLVSTAELVNGAFGQKLLDMVAYIAANYPNVDSISITELCYRVDGYGPDDLVLYRGATGNTDWPRLSNGQINIDDPSIGNWRSSVIGQFLGKASALAHQYGKQLYMDVSVNYDNLPLMTNNKGTNYVTMLQNVDKIVVWDYFGEAGYPPQISQDIAQFLTQFGLDRVILSVGLWGPTSGSVVSASDFQAGIQAAQAGGMPNIWICPGSMMSSAHWQVLDQLWGPH